MNTELLAKLKEITPEEQRILEGQTDVQKHLYTSGKDFIVDSSVMLARGKLIDIRPHTRFIRFPEHGHNYIEIIYMCTGSTTHTINKTTKIQLNTGDLLFLNQNITHEIEKAGEHDIAVNFIVLPEFFDRAFVMMEEENVLRDFLIGALKQDKSIVDYLHFQVDGILPVQNLVENMIWSLVHEQSNKRNSNQITMGLLFLQLLNHTDKMNQNDPGQYEQNILFMALKYIEETYRTATLEEFSSMVNQPSYYVSRLIRKHSGYTFKKLLQAKRLNQAAWFLTTTRIAVEDIIVVVGYDNSSYFHKIFKAHYGMTPKTYRDSSQ